MPRHHRRLAADLPEASRRSRLGPRSNLVLTQDQDARIKALVTASATFMGEPMPPTHILRAAVSIGLATLEQRFGLSPATTSSAVPAPTTDSSPTHYAAPRRKATALTRR